MSGLVFRFFCISKHKTNDSCFFLLISKKNTSEIYLVFLSVSVYIHWVFMFSYHSFFFNNLSIRIDQQQLHEETKRISWIWFDQMILFFTYRESCSDIVHELNSSFTFIICLHPCSIDYDKVRCAVPFVVGYKARIKKK